MNLQDLTDGTKTTKPWLNIVAHTVIATNITADEIESSLVTLDNVAGVPNPPIGSLAIFSNALGELSSTDPLGSTVTYTTSAAFSDALLQQGPNVGGNIPVYVDNVSLNVQDSGLSAQTIINLAAGASSIASQSMGVAPAGQRDLWQISPGLAGINGGIMKYIESQNILYSSDWSNGTVGAHYSLDGGVTWNPVVFDVVPANAMIFSYNEAGLYVAIGNFSAVDFSYTSVDGINYFSTGVVQANCSSINFVYSSVSNLFVAGINTDATHWISTSPDGITFTPRVTPDFTGLANYTELGQSSDTLVLVGDSQTQPVYSLDGGITWISGSGSSNPTQAITWSETKHEFLSMGVSSNAIRSSDGIVWEDLGTVGFGGVVSLIWVDFPIARYYAAYGGAGGFYNMGATIDPHLPFVQTHLDGSVVASQAYASVIHIPQYNRFLLGLDSLGVAYSTERPLIVKAMDNSMSVYPQYGNKDVGAIVSNTVAETSLLATFAGSNIIPANSMNLGSVTKIRFSIFMAGLVALSTVIIRLRGNGSQLWQSPVLTGAQVNQVLIGDIELVNVDNANPIISASFNQDASLPVLTSTGTALNYTVNDTFDLTAQFSAADPGNQIQMNAFNMTLMKF